jgi:hypothetical protein
MSSDVSQVLAVDSITHPRYVIRLLVFGTRKENTIGIRRKTP